MKERIRAVRRAEMRGCAAFVCRPMSLFASRIQEPCLPAGRRFATPKKHVVQWCGPKLGCSTMGNRTFEMHGY